ncbi:hypothetical protein [Actinocorallia populi]|uniref:hypothetical protein n=1 Tax=Actinocorallia populi TaxID=2079200 RepID=UPI000D0943D0|nr:hypothetical protein [Actinocorallia populi]
MTDPLSDHAARLASDAEALERCTVRLRALARRLRADEAAPSWLHAALDAHLTACTVAYDDLSTAAVLLRAHASGSAGPFEDRE